MAVQSYLPDLAGGMVAAASFADDERAAVAIASLRDSDVRPQDISVVARDARRAGRIAGHRAWTPGRNRNGALAKFLPSPLPREVKSRYARALGEGRVVVVAAADGQPAETLAALLRLAGGESVEQWWQRPAALFAPPELAGPF